jgi:hypothetical protein
MSNYSLEDTSSLDSSEPVIPAVDEQAEDAKEETDGGTDSIPLNDPADTIMSKIPNEKPENKKEAVVAEGEMLEKENESTVECAVCHDTSLPQSLAKIDGCSHIFCIACIRQWSEKENTCPSCKTRFTTIEYLTENGESVVDQVENKNQTDDNNAYVRVSTVSGNMMTLTLTNPPQGSRLIIEYGMVRIVLPS